MVRQDWLDTTCSPAYYRAWPGISREYAQQKHEKWQQSFKAEQHQKNTNTKQTILIIVT